MRFCIIKPRRGPLFLLFSDPVLCVFGCTVLAEGSCTECSKFVNLTNTLRKETVNMLTK